MHACSQQFPINVHLEPLSFFWQGMAAENSQELVVFSTDPSVFKCPTVIVDDELTAITRGWLSVAPELARALQESDASRQVKRQLSLCNDGDIYGYPWISAEAGLGMEYLMEAFVKGK